VVVLEASAVAGIALVGGRCPLLSLAGSVFDGLALARPALRPVRWMRLVDRIFQILAGETCA